MIPQGEGLRLSISLNVVCDVFYGFMMTPMKDTRKKRGLITMLFLIPQVFTGVLTSSDVFPFSMHLALSGSCARNPHSVILFAVYSYHGYRRRSLW